MPRASYATPAPDSRDPQNRTKYSYDAESHLTSTAGVNYTYDGDGKRVEKSNGRIYWYGIDGNVLDETDLSGSTTHSSFNEYVFFGGQRIGRRDYLNNVLYYLADHPGTSRINAQVPSGSTTATLCYDADFFPFGGERAYATTCTQTYKFTGEERDGESNLDNSGVRYSASPMGRFMTPGPLIDRLVVPQRLNLYAYVKMVGPGEWGRTTTALRPRDFESRAYANFATPGQVRPVLSLNRSSRFLLFFVGK